MLTGNDAESMSSGTSSGDLGCKSEVKRTEENWRKDSHAGLHRKRAENIHTTTHQLANHCKHAEAIEKVVVVDAVIDAQDANTE